ncbi:MAG: adenylate/guanylate cyclase domain-containing protein [Chloroflexi bacterium]|nr:adenylate/guanylate cyclase domain-containing protein [Chloroflexota bacterium]
MSEQELTYHWKWDLQSSPQALWPFFADTNRLNRDTGLSPVEEMERLPEEYSNNARHHLRYHTPIPFVHLDFEEEPFEWVFPYRYGVLRRFLNGPVDTFRVLANLNPTQDGGTHLDYQIWIRPRNILGRLGTAVAIGQIAPRRFDKVLRAYDQMMATEIVPYTAVNIRLSSGGEARLARMSWQLTGAGHNEALVSRLVSLLRTADDMTLSRIRPYLFADQWGTSRKELLELFLQATRVGLLDFQWEVLCPMCRGAEDRISNRLADVHSHAHCSTCNIDFDTNFENSVELTFAPNPAIRDVPHLEYCVAGPEITPHIIVQQLLPAGNERLVTPILEPGRYRLRAMALSGGQYFRVLDGDDGRDDLHIQLDGRAWSSEEVSLNQTPQLRLQNGTDGEHLLILERTAWSDQATTASEVIAMQKFRDLFANEALRPGEQIGVGSLTVLFTDLVDSTRMYREIGDAPAFGLVMSHFDVLHDVIDAEQGAIVKTIGDAIMAVFRRPVSALRVIHRAQEILQNPADGRRPLHLKAAVHTGPSIAVTLNERLDYFGTTINIASRLEKFARANDIILSDNVYADPEVREYLTDPYESFVIEPFEETLKGFDDECFKLWRVT